MHLIGVNCEQLRNRNLLLPKYRRVASFRLNHPRNLASAALWHERGVGIEFE
jgi:hypothetical protein